MFTPNPNHNTTRNPMPGPTPASTSWRELMSGVVGESLRVVSAHSRHFLALSLLFVLPLSSLLLLLLLPSLLLSFFNPDPPPSSSDPPQPLLRLASRLPSSFLAVVIIVVLMIIFLLLAAFSAISHSVCSGFFGRPVRLLPALFTLPSSIVRLLLTFPFLLLPLLLLSAPVLLSVRFLPSALAVPVSFLSAVPFAASVIAFSLSLTIAALEPSSYGLAPLHRSARLIKCMRPVPICLYILFASGIVLALWACRLREVGGVFAGWRQVAPVVARTVLGLAVVTVLFFYWMVSTAVMYLYCKAVHGELVEEIVEEFAREYVFLPFDEAKVPRVVSVVRY